MEAVRVKKNGQQAPSEAQLDRRLAGLQRTFMWNMAPKVLEVLLLPLQLDSDHMAPLQVGNWHSKWPVEGRRPDPASAHRQ